MILPPQVLEKYYERFLGIAEKTDILFPYLQLYLKQSRVNITSKRYIAMLFFNDLVFFLLFFLMSFMVLFKVEVAFSWLFALLIAFVLTFFVFFQQLYYPKMIINKRVRDLEKNSLPALQNMLIQLRSGVPLFDIMVYIAGSDYGEVSHEFLRVIKEINAGKNQVEALEAMTLENPSAIFRRAIWQMVNGMKTGSDMTGVIKEIMSTVSQEQLVQIERYGGQLSPLSMFYMIMAVIFPALGVNFLIVIASFIGLADVTVKMIFWGVYSMVFIFQFFFLGIIKSRRPSLLGEG